MSDEQKMIRRVRLARSVDVGQVCWRTQKTTADARTWILEGAAPTGEFLGLLPDGVEVIRKSSGTVILVPPGGPYRVYVVDTVPDPGPGWVLLQQRDYDGWDERLEVGDEYHAGGAWFTAHVTDTDNKQSAGVHYRRRVPGPVPAVPPPLQPGDYARIKKPLHKWADMMNYLDGAVVRLCVAPPNDATDPDGTLYVSSDPGCDSGIDSGVWRLDPAWCTLCDPPANEVEPQLQAVNHSLQQRLDRVTALRDKYRSGTESWGVCASLISCIQLATGVVTTPHLLHVSVAAIDAWITMIETTIDLGSSYRLLMLKQLAEFELVLKRLQVSCGN